MRRFCLIALSALFLAAGNAGCLLEGTCLNGICGTANEGGGGSGADGGGGSGASTSTTNPNGGGGSGADGGGGSTTSTTTSGNCSPVAAQDLAEALNQPCADLFAMGCDSSDPLTRVEVIQVLVNEVNAAGLLAGYKNPTNAKFPDVPVGDPNFTVAHRALWLELLAANGSELEPGLEADSCFVDPIVEAYNVLPVIYMVVDSSTAQQIDDDAGDITAVIYRLYGATPAKPLVNLTVSNNLAGNFAAPQNTTAVDSVTLGCFNQQQGAFDVVTLALVGGKAVFNAFNCADDAGATQVRIQLDPAIVAMSTEVRLGLDQTKVKIRGWPKADGGIEPEVMTINPAP